MMRATSTKKRAGGNHKPGYVRSPKPFCGSQRRHIVPPEHSNFGLGVVKFDKCNPTLARSKRGGQLVEAAVLLKLEELVSFVL